MTNYLEKGRKKIGIFRALQLGDMLCIIPAVRAIKHAYPDADITLIGLHWQRNFVKRFPFYFSDFIEFPGWPGLPERSFHPVEVISFLKHMQEQKFDLVIQMQGNGYIVNPMCMLFGAKMVAGLRKAEDFCPDERLFPVLDEEAHEIHRFLKVAAAVGAYSNETHLEFPILEEEEKNFQTFKHNLILKAKNYICVHPGARDPRRRWPAENFAHVADALAAKGYSIVLTGSIEEHNVLSDIADQMKYKAVNLVDACGQIGIGELAASIKYSAGLLSNDTGVSHIAAALKIPSVIIFSKYSDPQRWAPLDTALHTAISGDKTSNSLYVIKAMLDHLEVTVSKVESQS